MYLYSQPWLVFRTRHGHRIVYVLVTVEVVTLRITAGEPKKRKIWHPPMVLNGFLRLVYVFSPDKNMRRHDSITG